MMTDCKSDQNLYHDSFDVVVFLMVFIVNCIFCRDNQQSVDDTHHDALTTRYVVNQFKFKSESKIRIRITALHVHVMVRVVVIPMMPLI